MGNSSIGFSTGSVVVPATSETIDTCCRSMALRTDDFPACAVQKCRCEAGRISALLAWFLKGVAFRSAKESTFLSRSERRHSSVFRSM